MEVSYCKRLAIVGVMALLAGCQREAALPPPQPAASAVAKPVGAAYDTPQALTDEVIARASVGIPGIEGPTPMVIPTGKEGPDQYVLVLPGLVLVPDAGHRLLVTLGVSVNEVGTPQDPEASGGQLGLYEFTLREGRWHLTGQVPSFAQGGAWGKDGGLQPLVLGGGRVGIALTYIECHTGTCHSALEVLTLSAKGAKQVLSEPLHEDSDGWSGPCDAMVKRTTEAHAQGRTDFSASELHCYATDGQMSLQSRGSDEWPDIKLTFTGESVQIDHKTFEARHTSNAGELVLRYDGERYKSLSGRNPIQH